MQQAVTVNNEISSEAKHLQVPLMSAERAWAYAMQLKFEMNTDARKKFHMINRWVEHLNNYLRLHVCLSFLEFVSSLVTL